MVSRVVSQGVEKLISGLMIVMNGVRPGLRRRVIVSVQTFGVAACLTLATIEQSMMTSSGHFNQGLRNNDSDEAPFCKQRHPARSIILCSSFLLRRA